MKRSLKVLMLLLICSGTKSQTVDSIGHRSFFSYEKQELSILTGYNQGKYGFADIGIAYNDYGSNRHPFSLDCYISNEIKISDRTIIGPKIGAWVAGGFAMGLNLIYYTDFHQGSFVFRPEIGIGLDKTKFVYSYNFKFNRSFNGVNTHQVGLTHCFMIKRLKSAENTYYLQ